MPGREFPVECLTRNDHRVRECCSLFLVHHHDLFGRQATRLVTLQHTCPGSNTRSYGLSRTFTRALDNTRPAVLITTDIFP